MPGASIPLVSRRYQSKTMFNRLLNKPRSNPKSNVLTFSQVKLLLTNAGGSKAVGLLPSTTQLGLKASIAGTNW